MKHHHPDQWLNFGSGPAALPQEVLEQGSAAILDYNQTGLSLLSIPHRGKLFDAILEESKYLVRELCGIGNDYEVLWMHGGGRLQFCMIPLNFAETSQSAGYIDSGHWAWEAEEYAAFYRNSIRLSSSRDDNYSHLPQWPDQLPGKLAYVHFATNNTIYGTQWQEIPQSIIPLIADMSSDIFSRARAYNNCAMFYACAQKNIGPAGATLVVIHKDMLKMNKQVRLLPPMLSYLEHAEKNSLLNTPPVFAIYTSLLMLRWTKEKTIAEIEKESVLKSNLLYGEIERNSLFTPAVTIKEHRSRMNVCFRANNPEIEKGFLDFCTANKITGVEGHRTVGGFRVSLYNAIPLSAVEQLVALMKEYERGKE